jgi:general secretion pathway protein D
LRSGKTFFCGFLAAAFFTASCAPGRLRREGDLAFAQGAYEESLSLLERAVQENPDSLELRLQLLSRREGAVRELNAAADRARGGGDFDAASSRYRRVLAIDAHNDRAARGLAAVAADRRHAEAVLKAEKLLAAKQPDAAHAELRAVLLEDPAFAPALVLQARLDQSKGAPPAIYRLKSRDDRPVTLQFRDAPLKLVFEALARQTNLNFIFDKDVKVDAKTTIFVTSVPVEQAIDLLLAQNQLARVVLSENVALVYPNTPAKQKDYRDEIVHSFTLSNAAAKDAEAMLKAVIGVKTLYVDERSNTVVMRDTAEHVRMAEKLMATLDVPTPEVLMEVEVLEISHSTAEKLGITYPASATLALGKPAASTILTGSTGSGLVLSDLGKQSADSVSVSSLGISIDALKTLGATNVLSSPRIRTRNKEKAKILVGNRYPVVTSGTSATAGGAFSTSNVQYVEVGLTLEVQPTIHADGSVALKLSLEVSSILNKVNVPIGNGASTLAYEIGTRNTSTVLELKDGETQVLAGIIQDTEQRSKTAIPLLGELPVIGRLFGSTSDSRDKNEIVLSVTPRVVRSQTRPLAENLEFWYGSESQLRSEPFAPAASSTSSPAGAAAGTGSVSIASGGASEKTPPRPPTGPRAVPARIEASTGEPAAPAEAGDDKPRVTIDGPESAKVGEEISVTVRLTSGTAVGRVRTQVAFDPTVLQLVSADAGDIGSDAKVDTKAGGVQVDTTTDGALSGSLVTLRLRVAAVRAAASVQTQVVLVGEDGAAHAATQATPLKIATTQ